MLGSENMGSIGLSVPIGTGRASATQEIAKNEMNIRDSKTQTHKFLRLLEDYENLMAKGKEDMAIDIYRKMRVMADEYHLPYNTVSTNASQIIADYKEGKMAKTECIEELFGYPKGYINSSEYPDSIINNNKKAMKIDDFVDILLDVTAGDFENLGNLEEYMLKSRSEAERFEYALYQNIKNCKTIGQLSAQYENSNIADKIKVAAMLAGIANDTGYDDKLKYASIFGDRSKLAEINPEELYLALRNNTIHNTKIGLGICANIGIFTATFLRGLGVKANAVGIGTGQGMHVIAIAQDTANQTSYAVDNGWADSAKGDGIWPAIRRYAAVMGVNLLYANIYDDNNKFMGTYRGPEGRLMDSALGMEEGETLKRSLSKKNKE
jgi:hypothetical protein